MRTVKVNWREVSELSKRTLNNYEEFERARENYQSIINTIPQCWKGTDSETFVTNANQFLDYLKNETSYLSDMGNFFKAGSNMYNSTVSEHEEKIRRLNQRLDDEQTPDDIFDRSVA